MKAKGKKISASKMNLCSVSTARRREYRREERGRGRREL